jgi:hypothetical protein
MMTKPLNWGWESIFQSWKTNQMAVRAGRTTHSRTPRIKGAIKM